MRDDLYLEHQIEDLISRSPRGHAIRVLPAELEPELSFAFRKLARNKLETEASASAAAQPDEFRDRLRARVAAITCDCMRLFDRLMQGVVTEGGNRGVGGSCLCLRGWIESEIKEAVETKVESLTHVRQQPSVHQLRSTKLQDGSESLKPAPPDESPFVDTGTADVPRGEASTVQQGTEDQSPAGENTAVPGANSDTTKQGGTRPRSDKERQGDATLLGDQPSVSFRTAERYLGLGERQRQKLMKSGALEVEGQGHRRQISTESLRKYLRPKKSASTRTDPN